MDKNQTPKKIADPNENEQIKQPVDKIELKSDTIEGDFSHEENPRGFRLMIYFLIIMTVAYFVFIVVDQVVAGDPEPVAEPLAISQTQDVVFPATVVEREITYTKCGHSQSQMLKDDQSLVGKTYAELETEGWRVNRLAEGKLRISKQEQSLCPEDSEKRCIRLTEQGVGVYTGPLAADGELLYELPLNVELLPEEWRAVLLSGEPNAGFEFANEEELFQMLENLDEYVTEGNEYVVGGA